MLARRPPAWGRIMGRSPQLYGKGRAERGAERGRAPFCSKVFRAPASDQVWKTDFTKGANAVLSGGLANLRSPGVFRAVNGFRIDHFSTPGLTWQTHSTRRADWASNLQLPPKPPRDLEGHG